MTQPANTADTPRFRYTHALAGEIETRWQERWDLAGAFRQPNPGEPGFDPSAPKFYCLDMFPYPSGAGLHVGHPEGYTATDIVSRYKRMKGCNVLHPMGWDAFGLPAEQYAIQTGIHPAKTTRGAIDNFRRQLKRFGFSYDWSREFGTIDEGYYRWTQWIFLKLYGAWFDPAAGKARPIADLEAALREGKVGVDVLGELVARPPTPNVIAGEPVGVRLWHELREDERREVIDARRLAYLDEMVVNWCPKLGTVLANDEVIDGKSERGGHPVVRKPLRQWVFRITAYADRLLRQLDGLDWPASTKTMQAEWIGRSEGAEIEFDLVGRLSEPASTQPTPPSATRGEHLLNDPRPRNATAEGFVPRDPYPMGEPTPEDLMVQVRHLPHLELDGATYFVTWRTHGWNLNDAGRDAVMRALLYHDPERCDTYAACVMSNHVHWIVRPKPGHRLKQLVASVKRSSATEVNKIEGFGGALWQEEVFDHIIRDEAWLGAFVAYVARNPVKAGLARSVEDYPWTYVSAGLRTLDGRPLGLTGEWRPAGGGGEGEDVGSESRPTSLTVFTTRPDTLFGATYMVVAPEHELVDAVLASPGPETDVAALRAYVAAARRRSDLERQESKEKTGVFTGVYAVNPATGKRIPVWTADYVLTGYGTGAIMAVPAHDERDFEFAMRHGLPITRVVKSADPQGEPGFAVDVEVGEVPAGEHERLVRDFGMPETYVDAGWIRRVVFRTQKDAQRFREDRLRRKVSIHTERVVGFLPMVAEGVAVHSANEELSIDGMRTPAAKALVIEWLERTGRGRRRVNYKLRDWVFSRQRYWGEPFPIVYDRAGRPYPVLESALPVKLPDLADYAPVESDDPQPLLAKATAWVHTTAGEAGVDPAVLPPSTPVRRETNTMPGSAGSSWYAVRYCDARNGSRFVGREAEGYWMGGANPGVDLYVGGSEHAVGHLLYARFWQNVLFDLGEVSTPEPFRKLFHQGLITSFAYQTADKHLVPVDEVEEVSEGRFVRRGTGQAVTQIVAKMSKSLKNVVNPDDVIAEYGADTFRLYEMYMGPLEASKPWNPRDITGLHRFLQRLWRVAVDEQTGAVKAAAGADPGLEKHLHRVIAKVGADIERLSLNTAIAAMIEFVNAAVALDKGSGSLTADQIARVALVLSPFAPHLAEEVWSRLGREGFAMHQPWPTADAAMLVDDTVEVPVQVAGKVRSRIQVPAGADVKTHEAAAMADARVQEFIAGKPVKKVIVVPGKMVNVVV